MGRKERWYVVISFLCFVLLTIWLMRPESSAGNNKGISIRAAAVMPKQTNSFWEGVWQGVTEGALDEGLRLSKYDYSTGGSTEEMNEKLDTAILSDTQGIIFCANQYTESRTAALLKAARERGIRIVLCDTDADQELRDLFVGMDNEKVGKDCADYLKQRGSAAKILLVENREEQISGATRQREDVFLEEMGMQKQVEVLVLTGEGTDNYKILEDKLSSLENESAVVCFNSSTTIQTAQAVRRLELKKS